MVSTSCDTIKIRRNGEKMCGSFIFCFLNQFVHLKKIKFLIPPRIIAKERSVYYKLIGVYYLRCMQEMTYLFVNTYCFVVVLELSGVLGNLQHAFVGRRITLLTLQKERRRKKKQRVKLYSEEFLK